MFSLFQFELFYGAIHVPEGYISWCIFHEVHERDENFVTFQVTHPGNNKQSVPLNLAIFQERTTATIKSYFLNQLDPPNSWRFFIKFLLFAIPNNVSVHQTNLPMQQFKEITSQNSFFLWQTGLKHCQNVHHLPLLNKPLMLSWQRLDILLIWLVTSTMKTTITYLR